MVATTYDRDAVARLRTEPIDLVEKGLGGSAATSGRTAAEIAAAGLPLHGGDFILPVMTLRESALARDIDALARFCADAGIEHAPHAKTSMAPALFARQIDAGAWGLTAATAGQVQVYRRFGVARILLANQLVDPAGIAWIAAELRRDPGFEFCCYVDSPAGVRILETALAAEAASAGSDLGRPLDVLIEIGHPGGRTGVRDDADAIALAGVVEESPALRYVGVSAYEGGLGHGREPDVLAAVAELCARLTGLARRLAPSDGRPYLVSAGGSGYPDVVAEQLSAAGDIATVVLRSGSYVAHDHGLFARVSPFVGAETSYRLEGALELWAHVLSRPEPGRALLSAGRRDAPFDAGLPIPLRIRAADGTERPATGLTVSSLNDQHAFVDLDAATPLDVGEAVCLGISHPCTAFDKWRYLPVVDDAGTVLDVVRTFF